MPRSNPGRVLLPVSVALFALGVAAVLGVFVLFAAGREDLPLWLNLTCLLAPLGLALGLVGAVVARRPGR